MMSILDGSSKTMTARLLRTAASICEPVYATAMHARNVAYDLGLKKTRGLGRPTISVGNITTGGTGKTPIVRWLAARLRADGDTPAVLMRGYHATANGSDEQRELDRALNPVAATNIPVQADASRVCGAAAVLATHPEVSVFILDDAFQHRSAARVFDLVLVNAAAPFGFGHVLPRGLLREPLGGLARASTVLITHQSQVSPDALQEVVTTIKKYTKAPIFRADHVAKGLRRALNNEHRPMASLAEGSPLAVAGIGDPAAFGRSLTQHTGRPLPHHWFADHHEYTANDWTRLCADAAEANCDRIVTTEKDWSKLASFASAAMPVEVVQLAIGFAVDDEDRLYALIRNAIKTNPPACSL